MSTTSLPANMITSVYCRRNTAGDVFLALSCLTFFIATIIVPLRVYIRLCIVKNFWLDDVCLILSYLILIPTYALLWQVTVLGLGRHVGCYPLQSAITAFKIQYIAEVLEIFSTIFARTSVALFVIRLFAITKGLRKLLYAYTAFMILSLAITGCLVLGQCTPVAALWNPELVSTARCWSSTVRNFIDYYNGAVSILSDLLLALLPVYFLKKLQMKPYLKIALALLMAFGLLPAICAICRTALSVKQTAADPLYSSAILIVFGSIETSMLIIAATIPALRPLFQKNRRMGGSQFYAKKQASEPSRQITSNLSASQTKDTKDMQAYGYLDDRNRSSIGTTHSIPILEQHQRVSDDDIFLLPLEPSGRHTEAGITQGSPL